MHQHPSRTHLYKRVKLLTNLGEQAEAQALFDDLQARRLDEAAAWGHHTIRH